MFANKEKSTMESVAEAIGVIGDRLAKLEEVKIEKEKPMPEPPAKVIQQQPQSRVIQNDGEVKVEMMEDSGIKGAPVALSMEQGEPKLYPVPEEYIKVKDQILGPDFEMQMLISPDSSMFELQVIVPQNKSNASDLQKELSVKDNNGKPLDIRTYTFNQGSSASTITGWLTLMRQNLKLDD